jgi:hypothetical protein
MENNFFYGFFFMYVQNIIENLLVNVALPSPFVKITKMWQGFPN